MEHIIKKILTECGYVEKGQGILFHSKEDKSFFFTISIAEENFITLRNKELIKLNQEYKAVMDAFKTIVNSGEQITIEKNSSLIVLVKCANINSIANLQQQILLFEEDEYFFKKYVILYTDNSILELTVNPIIPQLRTKVNDNEKFNQFAAQGYVSEIAEYLVIIQFFIKLPFLILEHGTDGFISLNQKIITSLGTEQALYSSLLENAEEFNQIDFTNSEVEDRVNELLNSLPHD